MAMDFFGAQDDAKRRTKWLVFYFVIAVILLVGALNFTVHVALTYGKDYYPNLPSQNMTLVHLFTSVIGTAIILLGSLYKGYQLRHGGDVVALSLGGSRVFPDTKDPNEKQLVNIIEEMSIASGVPMPSIFVMNNETSINAFAAGHSTSDAAIGVTHGAVHKLTRDQLQGVIAHEFSHILHGDMKLNLRMVGILHGILLIAIIGELLIHAGFSGSSRRRYSSSSKKDGNPAAALAVVGIALWIIGSLGLLFGRIIKSATSRQREFLADAAAVQFTRNPSGIGTALLRLSPKSHRSLIRNENKSEYSHLFFANALNLSGLSFGMATHPPLEDRIKAILPDWDGRFDEESNYFQDREYLRDNAKPVDSSRMSAAERQQQAKDFFQRNILEGEAGIINPAMMAAGAAILSSIPDNVRQSAYDAFSARAIIYCLLLDDDVNIRTEQMKILDNDANDLVYNEVHKLEESIRNLNDNARLPLLEITFPSLRLLSKDQYKKFVSVIKALIAADKEVSFKELILYRSVRHHLDAVHENEKEESTKSIRHKQEALPSLLIIISAYCRLGNDDEDAQKDAFAAAMKTLNFKQDLLSEEESRVSKFDKALKHAANYSLELKRSLLSACAAAATHDGEISTFEREIIRLLGDLLEVPIPIKA